jgi:predicted CxxxxCH...CXXCH cytochrome family protein
MSSVNKNVILGLLFVAGLLILGGCRSENNGNAVFDENQHPSDWLPAGHMAAAEATESVCSECHGNDFSGGISGVSCTQCHIGGVNSVHPVSWGTGSQIVPNHGAYVVSNGTTSCSNAYCHGSDLSGVTNSGPACANCHIGGVSSLLSGCASCHGAPPNGSTDPNVTGAHTVHNALTNVTNVCNTCHNGAGAGTVNHDNGVVTVQLLSVYNAESGTAVYNNADNTCSNVSCHGGQTTPVWLTGSIDVNTQCTSCHSYGTTEYNSFVSGQHDFHVNTEGFPCIACHDLSKLAIIHFSSLNTTTIVGASTTVGGLVTDYTNGTCTNDCHVPRSWF